MSWLDQIITAITGLFSKQPTVTNVYQPTYGGSTTNIPEPIVNRAKPTPVKRRVIRTHRDFNPQFPSAKDYALAVRLNPDPRHLIPHMYANEGNSIKYVDIRGGSNTVSIAQLKAQKGIK